MSEINNAAKEGDVARVRELLDAGVHPDDGSATEGRPLWWAASQGRTEVAQLLLERGADPSLVTCKYTAYDMAKGSYPDTAALIKAGVPKPKPKPKPAEPAEQWVPMGKSTVAFVGTYPKLGVKLSQVFNFETRERVLLTENLENKAAAIGPSVAFDDLPLPAVQAALDEFERLGGKTDRDFVLQGPAGLNKPRRLPAGEPGHG
jgi:hypothetical protein